MPKMTLRRSGSTDAVAMPVTDRVFSNERIDADCAFASGYNAPKEIDTASTASIAITSCFDFFMILDNDILKIRFD
ncbi:hypothetical protein NZNM25_06550 [Nitrosopumilus zosterae]|uniref:Uncharacterized protein n=1 Tax=Nitrosopumilus zosterae TaxID=718286 RepID=A0A2S2KQH4_9ARCH|nr:hypothetical protein NZNM25_06550 [Nitrosopumilus zosterae]